MSDVAGPPPPPKVQESFIDAVGKIDIATMLKQMDMYFLNNPGTRLFGNQYLLPAAFKASSLPGLSEQALQRKIIADLGAVLGSGHHSLSYKKCIPRNKLYLPIIQLPHLVRYSVLK